MITTSEIAIYSELALEAVATIVFIRLAAHVYFSTQPSAQEKQYRAAAMAAAKKTVASERIEFSRYSKMSKESSVVD